MYRRMENAVVSLCAYRPLRGGTYLPLPEAISQKKGATLNIRTKDHLCLLDCILAKLHPCDDSETMANDRIVTSNRRKHTDPET